ncbi:unnamed protein product [Notodromas monacha]|uniref:Transcription factor CBF/NF-Y/archaeal histone domain-containing protein n=1 Tax=Notodromas monacha TaxID=399045 RepID=A0A7R9BWG6_9CRUS|nr:unnamed protein product [Notodromas monacha]CAG0923009.1 unnamed protein product [Notodromas monacha]
MMDIRKYFSSPSKPETVMVDAVQVEEPAKTVKAKPKKTSPAKVSPKKKLTPKRPKSGTKAKSSGDDVVIALNKVAKKVDLSADVRFPVKRLRRIMKSIPRKTNVSADSIALINKAAEMFITYLSVKSYENALKRHAKTLTYDDVAGLAKTTPKLAWLREVLCDRVSYEEYEARLGPEPDYEALRKVLVKMADGGFDPCECVWSHMLSMRRLMNILRNSQEECNDQQCSLDLPGLQRPEARYDDMTTMFMVGFMVIGMLLMMVHRARPRNTPEKPKGNNGDQEKEYEWFIREEVPEAVLRLRGLLADCIIRIPVQAIDSDTQPKTEKYVISSPSSATDSLKCIVTVCGENVVQADLTLKISRLHNNPVIHTQVVPDAPWKLQQIQDASNHVKLAIMHLENIDIDQMLWSGEEVSSVFSNIMASLKQGRTALVIPKKRTIEELLNSKNVKSLVPPLPGDVAVSFYLQSHKLVVAGYHLSHHHGHTRFEMVQADTSLVWLSQVLMLITTGLQVCQQVKDKVQAFSQDIDFNLRIRRGSLN